MHLFVTIGFLSWNKTAEILRANDELTKAIDEYRRKVGKEDIKATPASPEATPTSSSTATTPAPTDTSASSLIDLGQHQENNGVVDTNTSVLDDELKALGKLPSGVDIMMTVKTAQFGGQIKRILNLLRNVSYCFVLQLCSVF